MEVLRPRLLTDIAQSDRIQLLVDAVKDYAIYLLDAEGHVATWNTGAERFKGYTAEEIIGHHFSTFYTEEDRAIGLPARALHTAATEGRFEAEGWRLRKDGTRFWTHVVIDPVIGEGGDVIGYAKITRDMTDRRVVDEALVASEQRFRMLVQGVHDYAIYMLDPDGHVTNWNAGAQAIKGYTAEEIVGQHFSRFYTEEDRAAGAPARALATALAEGKFKGEAVRVRKSGERFWASVVIDPIRDDRGDLVGFAKVTRDITERREAELELERSRSAG
jgi:PAS domain S-box-containing protein